MKNVFLLLFIGLLSVPLGNKINEVCWIGLHLIQPKIKTLMYLEKNNMRFTELIQNFPEALKTQPQIFDIKDLQDLDIILTELDSEADEVIDKIKNWFRTHTTARDALIQFASRTRQINSSPRPPASSEASIIQNLMELRRTNQEIISQNNQNSPKNQMTNNDIQSLCT